MCLLPYRLLLSHFLPLSATAASPRRLVCRCSIQLTIRMNELTPSQVSLAEKQAEKDALVEKGFASPRQQRMRARKTAEQQKKEKRSSRSRSRGANSRRSLSPTRESSELQSDEAFAASMSGGDNSCKIVIREPEHHTSPAAEPHRETTTHPEGEEWRSSVEKAKKQADVLESLMKAEEDRKKRSAARMAKLRSQSPNNSP